MKDEWDVRLAENEYMHNKRFRDYVDKYAQSNGFGVKEALGHAVVRSAYYYYTEV